MAVLSSGVSKIKQSHWYTVAGEPAHRTAKASGAGDRATTIRDAIANHYLPSVTNIGGILDKPALTSWKIEQVLKAADANKRAEAESFDYWSGRIQDVAFDQVSEAAELGTKVHGALDAAFDGREVDPEVQAYVRPVLAWIQEKGLQITHREQRVVSAEHGYAGTVDVLFRFGKKGIGILDYKTKKTKPGEKVDSYFEHKIQLSAYAGAFYGADRLDDVLAANLFISTTEPGRVEVIKHDRVREYYDAFLNLCAVWRAVKGYDPRQPKTTA